MTNEERTEKIFSMNAYIRNMKNALYGQRVIWVVAKNLENGIWMEQIEKSAKMLKEKISAAEKEYELLLAGDCGLQCSIFEGGTDEETSQNTAGSPVAGCA